LPKAESEETNEKGFHFYDSLSPALVVGVYGNCRITGDMLAAMIRHKSPLVGKKVRRRRERWPQKERKERVKGERSDESTKFSPFASLRSKHTKMEEKQRSEERRVEKRRCVRMTLKE